MPTRVGADDVDDNNGEVGDVLIVPAGAAYKSPVNGDGNHAGEGPNRGEVDEEETLQPREVLENPRQKRARRISHLVAYITTFIMAVGFSIVLTGVWPYLQQLSPGVSKQFLGWVISANPLGQMLASPLLGIWANKAGSIRGAFLMSVLMFTVGNALYAILSVFGTAAIPVMIFSRFLVGVSSANIAIIRSYIAASTRLSERTTAVALTSASQGLGFIFGPAIQTALALAFSHGDSDTPNNSTSVEGLFEEAELDAGGLGIQWNMYTATGWIGVVLGIINFFLFMPCIFQEHHIAAKEAQLQMKNNPNINMKLPKPDYVGIINVLSSFFIILMIYVLLETLVVPMCIDMYAWTDKLAITVVGIGLSIAGAMSIVTFMLAGWLSKRIDERKVFILFGLFPMTVAMLLHFPMGNTYPKMKNCTSPHPITTPSPEITSLPINITDSFTTLSTLLISGEVTTIETILDDTERDRANLESVNNTLNLSSTTTLRRRRRHALRDHDCEDLGCPTAQEWCYYTPIIEKSQLVIANIVAIFGYPIAFTIASSLFSKMIGPKPQGVWMGILTSTGSLSRVTGPIIVTYMYTDLGTRWTFGILFFIMLFTLICNIVLYKRMVPMKVGQRP